MRQLALVSCVAILGLAACNRPQGQSDVASEALPVPQAQTVAASQSLNATANSADLRASGAITSQQQPNPRATDAYLASQQAYRAALVKAQSDHRSALTNCESLSKAAQKSCKQDADEQLKMAKTEAARLKPAS